jgi:hypothetical protein
VLWIRIGFNADPNPAFNLNADLDPAFNLNADPDPAFNLNADPDPGQTLPLQKVEFLNEKYRYYVGRCLFGRLEIRLICCFWSCSLVPGSGSGSMGNKSMWTHADPDPQQ